MSKRKYLCLYRHKYTGERKVKRCKFLPAKLLRMIRLRDRINCAIAQGNDFVHMGTLTYNEESLPYAHRHVSEFFKAWRTWAKRHNKGPLMYVWTIGFGKKTGRPHYHYVANMYVPKEIINKWWSRGFCLCKKISANDPARISYVLSYMQRQEVKELQGRISGYSRNLPRYQSKWEFISLADDDEAAQFSNNQDGTVCLAAFFEPGEK